jgi:hypothetical protein
MMTLLSMDMMYAMVFIVVAAAICWLFAYIAARSPTVLDRRGYQPQRLEGPEVDLLAHPPESDEPAIQPPAYAPVPPTRTFYVKTRYVFCGKGEPTPFELDE